MKPFIGLLFLASMAALGANAAPTCCAAWELFGDKCYLIIYETRTWAEAEAKCALYGGHLATAETSAIQSYLHNKNGGSSYMWIGGNDMQEEGEWKWTDSNVKWDEDNSIWYSTYPRDSESYNCLAMRNGVWYDYNCCSSNIYACSVAPEEDDSQ